MNSTSTNNNERVVVIDTHEKRVSLFRSKFALVIDETGRRQVECPLNQVLWAEVTEDKKLCLSLLHRKTKRLALRNITGTYDSEQHEAVARWTEDLMGTAYEGIRRGRRFKVMINPHGGPGKARSIFERKVKPILDAAHCTVDVMVTEYYKHCYDYSKTMSLDYDAVVLLSGDGLVHEVFNAFAERDDATDAFAVPVVQIPTGSANGLSLCILGLKDGLDVCAATLNAIKGRRMDIDLCSIQQEGKQIISFMSQAIGMMADIDLGTESLRWMGDARFLVGFIREVGANKRCPVKLEIQVATQDKKRMVQTYRASRSSVNVTSAKLERDNERIVPSHSAALAAELPSPELANNSDGWSTIDKPLVYVYAGKLPYVSRDLMQFPVALSDDGYIDIVAQEHCSRKQLLKSANGAAEGRLYWVPTQHYFKAKAFRVTPLTKKGNLALDGERYPFAPFQVEVRPRMGTTLGAGGWYPLTFGNDNGTDS